MLGTPLTLNCVPPENKPWGDIEWKLRDQSGRVYPIHDDRGRRTVDLEGKSWQYVNITFFTEWNGRLSPHKEYYIYFILTNVPFLQQIPMLYDYLHMPCDSQNYNTSCLPSYWAINVYCNPAIWPFRLLEINMRDKNTNNVIDKANL